MAETTNGGKGEGMSGPGSGNGAFDRHGQSLAVMTGASSGIGYEPTARAKKRSSFELQLAPLYASSSQEVRDERDDQQHEKNVEDDLGNAGRGDGDAAEPEYTGNDCYHEKGQGPA